MKLPALKLLASLSELQLDRRLVIGMTKEHNIPAVDFFVS